MVDKDIERDGFKISLSGDQVKFIRNILGEGQREFGKRFAVANPVIHRLEKKGTEHSNGPLIILIHGLAKHYGITIPEKILNRENLEGASSQSVSNS